MADFTQISKKYENDSIVQRSASEILLEIADIKDDNDVLDLGCGTGHLTRLIKEKTNGRVIGIDPAQGMIEQAARYRDEGLSFRRLASEQLDYQDEFDVIFCNSAFQWFSPPEAILNNCCNALRVNGRMAIQAPARKIYCPNFLEAVEAVKADPSTRETFADFTAPWFFLETAEQYKELFEQAGFSVTSSIIDKVTTHHSAGDIFKIFESGAAAGYLNQQNYSMNLTKNYADSFRAIIRKAFQSQEDRRGMVELSFYRIYLLAVKQGEKGVQ